MVLQEGIFERIEKKYILSQTQYDGLTECMKPYMQADQYGTQTLMSIYCDTAENDLIRRSLDRPVYKEKLRVRAYGYPVGDEVYVELKKKYKGIVYKRREAITKEEAMGFLNGDRSLARRSQILKEACYFMDYYGAMPKMMILCERTAYESVLGEGIRMTLDSNIRYRVTDLDFSSGTSGIPYAEEPLYVLELKVDRAMPLWLSHALSELKIYPHRFSKYGQCYIKKVLGERKNA